MKIRKIVSTILIAAMLFFAPSMIPVRAGVTIPCHPASGWLATDTAFATILIPCPVAPPHTWSPSRMVVGRIRLSGIDHPLWHSRQLPRQPTTDICGSVDVRLAVLVCEAAGAALKTGVWRPQSSKASRLTAGALGFLTLSQCEDRPE
jgi:hypothetical protein